MLMYTARWSRGNNERQLNYMTLRAQETLKCACALWVGQELPSGTSALPAAWYKVVIMWVIFVNVAVDSDPSTRRWRRPFLVVAAVSFAASSGFAFTLAFTLAFAAGSALCLSGRRRRWRARI